MFGKSEVNDDSVEFRKNGEVAGRLFEDELFIGEAEIFPENSSEGETMTLSVFDDGWSTLAEKTEAGNMKAAAKVAENIIQDFGLYYRLVNKIAVLCSYEKKITEKRAADVFDAASKPMRMYAYNFNGRTCSQERLCQSTT
ncbi:hypothetical protein MMC28_001985 [Mycoblastus sanguinarius]|nr:hypothetical protein [Mycoblastus sanguinarius]